MRALGLVAAVLLCQSGSAYAQSILPEGLTIHLVTKDGISSKKARKGDPVSFVVRDPVVIGGVTLVPAGSPALGQVTAVRDNGLFGRSGKLEISVSHVEVGGRQIPVRGASDRKGASGAAGAVGAAVVFLPLGIFVRGREAQLKPGTPVDVYVAHEVSMVETAASPPATSQQSAETLMPIPLPPSAAAEPEASSQPETPPPPAAETLPPLPP